MNSAQRAAFVEMVKLADTMSVICFMVANGAALAPEQARDIQQRYDAARNRYFELDAEAKKAKKSSKRNPLENPEYRQALEKVLGRVGQRTLERKGLGRKSTAGR